MVLNTDLKEIMMDHTLRTISYIADIGDLVVLMARRRPGEIDGMFRPMFFFLSSRYSGRFIIVAAVCDSGRFRIFV